MSAGFANLSFDLDYEGNFTFVEDFEVFTFRDAVNVAAYMVMSAGQERKDQICVCVFSLELIFLRLLLMISNLSLSDL